MSWKIKNVRAIPVNLPYKKTPVMMSGAIASSTRTIIAIETTGGAIGIGEASYAFPAAIIEHDFAKAMVGLDALDLANLRRYCLPRHLDAGTPSQKMRLATWGGIEIALWDLMGKAAGLPLYRLLGGRCRDKAQFVAYAYAEVSAQDPISRMAERAKEAIDETGAPIFEFKVGVYPVDQEIAIVEAVRDALKGRAKIAVDANMGFSYQDARQFLASTGSYLENVEEPVESLAEMESLAHEFGVNVSTHCSDLNSILHRTRIKGVVPTLDVAGGISGIRALSEALEPWGRNVWLRSHAESGIGWAAMVHLGISLRNLRRPGQALIDQMEDDLVLGECWNVRNGGVVPPERPGLGIEADWAMIEKYHQAYLDVGEVQSFATDLNRS